MTSRQKAARKGARTRAMNIAMLKRWREIDEPSNRRIDELVNALIRRVGGKVTVEWNPIPGLKNFSRKLKHGVIYGDLLRVVRGGKGWIVKPEGYSRPQDFPPGFWKPRIP